MRRSLAAETASTAQPWHERTIALVSFPPPIRQNPYQGLLYQGAEEYGVLLGRGNRLKLGWLFRNRSAVDVLHFHWPEGYYRHGDAATRFEQLLSWPRLWLFASRLAAARALGYRIVWTVHQTRPHESPSALVDLIGTRILARACHLAFAHDAHSAARVRRELGLQKVEIVPHGSYIGVYSPGRSREVVRRELGLMPDACVFLFFGHLRRYKELGLLVSAIKSLASLRPSAVLVVAGLVVDSKSLAVVREATADRKIVLVEGFVAVERVAELFGAADVAVLPRADGGTSGSLILALSLGLPPIVADAPAYVDLIADGQAGWAFEAGSVASLADAMTRAVDDGPSGRGSKSAAARAVATSLSWSESSSLFAAHLRRVVV